MERVDSVKVWLTPFIAATTDAKRLQIIGELGTNPLNHAIFTALLKEFGHAHDWICYRDLMHLRFGDK
jgi:hypothetical protein